MNLALDLGANFIPVVCFTLSINLINFHDLLIGEGEINSYYVF